MVEGIPVDRARLRFTATYAVTDRLSLGLEANPKDDDYGVLANWRVLDETSSWPALILGTSSDRIGTTSGRAYYATLSKDLEAWTGLPVGPYVGAAYGEFDDELVAIGGLRVRWAERWASTHLWDSENLHHVLDVALTDGWRIGALLVEQDGEYYAGATLGVSF